MPIFKEYIAKGKLTPTDMGFTAFETAARRQQSFTADQQASIEKSAKAVGQAWEGALKFGLDEIEMQQHERGGGGVRQGSARVERTLIGTGTNPGITRNEVSRGTRDLSRLARDINNRVQKPLTAADGITVDPDSGTTILRGDRPTASQKLPKSPDGLVQPGGPGSSEGTTVISGSEKRVVLGTGNLQQIPLGPGDINLRRLTEYGVNPQKQIIQEPLSPSLTPEGEEAFKEGTVAGRLSAGGIYGPTNPFTKTGSGIWSRIEDSLGIGSGTNVKDMTLGTDLKPSGYDKSGVPFYGTVDNPLPRSSTGDITPTPANPDNVGQDFTTYTPPDTDTQANSPLPDASGF